MDTNRVVKNISCEC